jgi:hypothetical protein
MSRLVGYESDAAFSKAFKRVVGANTGEYIKHGFEGCGHAGMAEDFESEDTSVPRNAPCSSKTLNRAAGSGFMPNRRVTH